MISNYDDYRKLKKSVLLVGEENKASYVTDKMTSVSERLVRCFWYDQLIDAAKVRATDGRNIKIFSQGEWNTGPGPDFKEALVRFDSDDTIKCDIEIHVRSSEWKNHGHDKNPEYDSVGLHVVLWNDSAGKPTLNSRGESIPQLVLAECLEDEIDTLAARIDMENYPYSSESRVGDCSDEAARNPERLKLLLEMAGADRIFYKAARMDRELRTKNLDTVFYRTMMEGFGYGGNKTAFRRLAGIVSLSAIKKILDAAPHTERAAALQAVFIGASGLLEGFEIPLWDAETRALFSSIEENWSKYSHLINRDRMAKNDWSQRSVRPANFPIRRVVGAGALMADRLGAEPANILIRLAGTISSADSFNTMKKAAAGFRDSLVCEGVNYWANRVTPGGKRVDRVPALIGAG
ncbi:MAG TPA: DUF2851 family protein, partial [bacterium]|nr:DUF2851 family protein [bacterium]